MRSATYRSKVTRKYVPARAVEHHLAKINADSSGRKSLPPTRNIYTPLSNVPSSKLSLYFERSKKQNFSTNGAGRKGERVEALSGGHSITPPSSRETSYPFAHIPPGQRVSRAHAHTKARACTYTRNGAGPFGFEVGQRPVGNARQMYHYLGLTLLLCN